MLIPGGFGIQLLIYLRQVPEVGIIVTVKAEIQFF